MGAPIRKALEARDGQPTIVRFASGEEIVVFDVAFGRDHGDPWEHVTANCSPAREGREIHFFSMSEVASILDPDTMRVLMEQEPDPGEI